MLHKHIYGEEPPRPAAKPIHVPFWRRLPWYVFQTAVVGFFVWFDHVHANPSRPGLALAMGTGMAIAFTVLFHLCWNGIRRLVQALRPVVRHEKSGESLPPTGSPGSGQVLEHFSRPRVGDDPG